MKDFSNVKEQPYNQFFCMQANTNKMYKIRLKVFLNKSGICAPMLNLTHAMMILFLMHLNTLEV